MDGSGEGVDSRQQRQVVLLRQWIHQTVGTTGIKRERVALLIRESINEVISLLDLPLAQSGQLVVAQGLDLTAAEVIQRRWLEARDGVCIEGLDLAGLEGRDFGTAQRFQLPKSQTRDRIFAEFCQ